MIRLISFKLLVLIALLFSTNSSYTQENSTELKEIWENETLSDSIRFGALEEYYENNHQSNPDSALVSLDYYYELAKKKNATRQMFRSLNKKANIYRLKEEYEKSRKLYRRAQELALKLNDPRLEAIVIGNLGNIFLNLQDYQNAARQYSTALKIFREVKDKDGEARMLTSLGSINFTIGNEDIALDYYNKSLSIYEKHVPDDHEAIAIGNMNIGLIHLDNEDFVSAKRSFLKALTLLEIDNSKYYKAGCYLSLAIIYLKLDQIDIASHYAQKNLTLNEELNIQLGILSAEILIAQITFETNVDSATQKAERILENLPSNASYDVKKELFELLYQCYKKQNKLDLSLEMLERFTKYQDSIQLKKNSFAVVRELVRNDYESELHKQDLISKKEKEELKNTHSRKTLFIVSTSIILLLLVLVYFILKGRKNNLRRNILLEEIENLKSKKPEEPVVDSKKFELSREKLEKAINRKLNETDWNVLTILLEDPVMSNKEIAEKAFMSVDGIGSSLRRMYEYFEVKESKYKKISLLLESVKISNQNG